jgi:hypothetical protein
MNKIKEDIRKHRLENIELLKEEKEIQFKKIEHIDNWIKVNKRLMELDL